MSEQTPRKDWPHAVQFKVLTDLMKETPRDLLSKYVTRSLPHHSLTHPLTHLVTHSLTNSLNSLTLSSLGSYGVLVLVPLSGGMSHRPTVALLLSCV